jgi:ATP-binding cassette subfamily F protein uup
MPLLWPAARHTQQVLAELAEAEQALEEAFERWEYLEGLKNGA